MNQLVALSFYTAPITLPPHSSNLGASVTDGAEGLIIDNMREGAGLAGAFAGQCISREIICSFLFLFFLKKR